jgi:DNA-binding transcriptional LysR family regulator
MTWFLWCANLDKPVTMHSSFALQITLRQLTYFVAAAETGQVSRAAARCYVSQPSLTIALKNLEDVLQVRLFTRHPDGLRLTVHGESFLHHAEHVLATLDAAVEETRGASSAVSGAIVIPVTDTISQYLLPRILIPMRKRLPNIRIDFVEGHRDDIQKKIISGEYPFALLLVSNIEAHRDIRIERLKQSPRKLWTALGHPMSLRDQVGLEEIQALPFILLDMDDHVRTVEGYWGKWGLTPNVVFRTKSIEAVRSLVAQDVGVTILSDLVFRTWSHDGGRIHRTRIVQPVPSMDIGLAIREDAELSPASAVVLTTLRSLADRLDQGLNQGLNQARDESPGLG